MLASLLVAHGAGVAGAAGRGADGEFDTRTSAHFILYQDVDIDRSAGIRGSRHFELAVLADLERAYDRLGDLLGLRPQRRIEVVVYDPAIFDHQFAGLFRFAAAGFYHGVIRVRGAELLHVGLTRVLHHELVHAALDAAAPSYSYPGWFNEGLAEWFEARAIGKRHLSAGELSALIGARRAGALNSIDTLSRPSFAGMGPSQARVAYLQAYGMFDHLSRRYGERKLRQFCLEVVRSRDMRRALRRAFRTDLVDLEARFLADLKG